MNGHIEMWIDAYLDDQLPAVEKQKVAAHLSGCTQCRREFKQRQTLSALLKSDPDMAARKSERQFIAEVSLILPRRQDSLRRTAVWAIFTGWQLFPLLLTIAGAYVQAVFICTFMLNLIPGANQLLAWDTFFYFPFAVMPGWLEEFLAPLSSIFTIDPGLWVGMAVLVVIGVLACSWLASWWVRSQNNGRFTK